MRFPLAALALAATVCLFASQGVAAQAEEPSARAGEALGAALPPAGMDPASAETPPPFVVRPKRPPQPPRKDLTFATRPAPADFRGLAWGASLEQATATLGLKPVTEPRPLPNTFQRPGEPLKLGQADIRTVAYYFHKGVFNGVGILFEGEANFFLVKDHLIGLYGPGRQLGSRYGWTWTNVNIDLRLHEGVGELRYTHEP